MKKVFSILTNKFLLTAAGFFVWMIYFDQYDYFMMKQRSNHLKELKKNIAYLETEVARMEKERNGLLNNPAHLERFARERYFMKRDNEDLYVIEEN